MPAADPRPSIQQALITFSSRPLPEAAAALYATLGYTSDRTLRLNSVKQFREAFDQQDTLTAKERASLDRLTSLHFLFQLTDAELSNQSDLFSDPGTVDGTRIHSYLFLAAELPAGDWSRTELTAIARALNKPLPMPALVLFRHGEFLSLAVIHRRLNKVAADRDVLEKATLIRGIRCAAPHRAHVEILADLAFDSLKVAHNVTNFVQLHAAWRNTLDIQELNKRFYQQLQHWYFWALGEARFPVDAPKDAEGRDALSLIRLLTRLIFVWFLKEKGLVPETLFDERRIAVLLKGFAPANARAKESVYYRAILQNLFFATLNCEQSDRGWAREGQNMMAHSLYRFRDEFTSPASALDLFKDIPFLNGGLFECLDKDLGEGHRPRYVRIDGFSRRDDSQPVVPDFLFFGPERDIDLSAFYEERASNRRARPVNVRGLISILQDFKFTIEENTPLEEDVALDPELLGRVFENLLAAYNPETQVTARKQTGSFYTPREIVDYMTGQALFYALREKLQSGLATRGAKDAEDGTDSSAASTLDQKLQSALAHDDAPNPFNAAETAKLIAAVDDLKILDPACGSGAFPMGVLHRLVHLLGKLDPGNVRWKQRQLDKVREIPDPDVREQLRRDIEQAFAANELGYGRKLYLIENCLYGVDIQPIAAQITKLRFFISLIVEQKVDSTAANRGIRPLPNLETKIVAANTLIGIERPGQQLLRNLDIDAKEAELRRVRDDHFLARTPKKKAKCREEDARLRAEIAALLKDDGWDSETAKKLAGWDPYDQNASAPFFDNEWMFGLADGFDMVIGNPPYGVKFSAEEKARLKSTYATIVGKYDSYGFFFERAFGLGSKSALVSYITPHTWLSITEARTLREHVLKTRTILEIVDLSEPVFGEASVDAAISLIGCAVPPANHRYTVKRVTEAQRLDGAATDVLQAAQIMLDGVPIMNVGSSTEIELLNKIRRDSRILEEICLLCVGVQAYDSYAGQSAKLIESRGFHASHRKNKTYRREIGGREVERFSVNWRGESWISYGDWLAHPRESHFFQGERILVREITAEHPRRIFAAVTDQDFVTYKTVLTVKLASSAPKPWTNFALLGLLNSTLYSWLAGLLANKKEKKAFPRISLFDLKRFPIPRSPDKNTIATISKLAKVRSAQPDAHALEAEIDRHVYALYGLTDAEIALVEGSAEQS